MRTLILGISILLTTNLSAQYFSYGYGMGSSTFRGETSSSRSIIESPGLNAYGFYSYWLPKDERWQITALVDLNLMSSQKSTTETVSYQAQTALVSTLLGMKYYFDSELPDYEPEKKQDAVFLGLFAGPSFFAHQYGSMVDVSDKEAFRSQLGISFTMMGQIGYRYYLNQWWAIETSLGGKYGWNDHWDGYKGITNNKDWLFQGNIGVLYSFY